MTNTLETQVALEEEDSHTSITSDPFTNVTADNSPDGPTVKNRTSFGANIQGEEFCAKVNQAYEEVVYWHRNLFQIPSGSARKAFITELALLYQAYADGSSLESVAMKACTVAPILLLQKPS